MLHCSANVLHRKWVAEMTALRKLTVGERRVHGCANCAYCSSDKYCIYDKCPIFAEKETAPKKKRKYTRRFVYVEAPPPKPVNKKLIWLMHDANISMVDIASKLNIRPQKVADIIEERRKSKK